MPTRSLNPVCPGWPADRGGGDSTGRLRRVVALSLLVHGLVLSLKFQFWPFFAADRSIQPISVRLAPPDRPTQADPPPARVTGTSTPGRLARSPQPSAQQAAAREENTPSAASSPDVQAMIARARSDMEAASRRQMLDPMFAGASRQAAAASPLERAAAPRAPSVEQLAGQRIRVTAANGHRYCLQELPEAATRDIPMPVIAVPTNCP